MIVLVVDDQKSMCWILSKILSEAGFTVKTAGTAGEAVSVVAGAGVSVAVIDYRLPDMSGLDLFSELKKQCPPIPAVLISSYGSKQLREEALRLGFSAYFDKPLDNHSFVLSIQNILGITT